MSVHSIRSFIPAPIIDPLWYTAPFFCNSGYSSCIVLGGNGLAYGISNVNSHHEIAVPNSYIFDRCGGLPSMYSLRRKYC